MDVAVVVLMAAFGLLGLIISVLLIVLSVQRLVVLLAVEHKSLVTAVAIAGAVGSLSDLVYAAATVSNNVFDNFCRTSRYCSLFAVLAVPTILLVNSCGRLIEVKQRTAARRLVPIYWIATGVIVVISFLLIADTSSSTQAVECNLPPNTLLFRAVYVCLLGCLTTVANYFMYRELDQLRMVASANVNNRATAHRVRESLLILQCTVFLTAYVMLLQVALAIVSEIDSSLIDVFDVCNSLNALFIGALLLVVLPQYRGAFMGVKHTHRLLVEPSKVATEAESVPRVVVVRSPTAAASRQPRLSNAQRKGVSPFPPVMRHLYDVSALTTPSTSISSGTDILSFPSTVWPAAP